MTDNTELQRLTRLGRQIAASCRRSRTRARLAVARVCARAARGGTEIHQQADIEKGGASSAAGGAAGELHGRATLCPPVPPLEPDRGDELTVADDDEVDEDAVTGR